MRKTDARLVSTGSDHRAVIVTYDIPAPAAPKPPKEPAVTRYSRAEWGARPPKSVYRLDATKVTGLVFHWPAMKSPLRTVAAVMAGLRSWQNYHMDDQGWRDIAYQVAVDQAGNRYELRGLSNVPGANGDTASNATNGAVLLVLAPGEEPTDAMVAEVRNVVADHRALFPRSTHLRTHNDVRPEPTACPGPAATRLIRAGAFEPTQEDDMPLSDDDAKKIAYHVWAHEVGGGDNRKYTRLHLIQAANASLRNEAKAVDPQALAAAVVAALPAGRVDEATVVAGVKRALAELVNEEKS